MPNSRGIAASGCSRLVSVLLSVATPTADRDVPAMKLADAEKHTGYPFRCMDVARGANSEPHLRCVDAAILSPEANGTTSPRDRRAEGTLLSNHRSRLIVRSLNRCRRAQSTPR